MPKRVYSDSYEVHTGTVVRAVAFGLWTTIAKTTTPALGGLQSTQGRSTRRTMMAVTLAMAKFYKYHRCSLFDHGMYHLYRKQLRGSDTQRVVVGQARDRYSCQWYRLLLLCRSRQPSGPCVDNPRRTCHGSDPSNAQGSHNNTINTMNVNTNNGIRWTCRQTSPVLPVPRETPASPRPPRDPHAYTRNVKTNASPHNGTRRQHYCVYKQLLFWEYSLPSLYS